MEFREANRFRVHQLRAVLRWLRYPSVISSLRFETTCFRCEAGTKAMAHPARQKYRAATSLLKQHDRRDDVAEPAQHVARMAQRILRKADAFLHSIEDRRPPGWMANAQYLRAFAHPDTTRKEGSLGKLSTAPAPQAPYRNRVRQYAGNLIGAFGRMST